MRCLTPMILCLGILSTPADATPAVDHFPAGEGSLEIHFLGHGTLMLRYGGKTVHVDPVSRYADYASLPEADLILLTHAHGDHLDPEALQKIRRKDSLVVYAPACRGKISGGQELANGESGNFAGFEVEAVPAYNIQHLRETGVPFHPKGEGNGYVLRAGQLRVYLAGDTENIPEMKERKNIDIAFLPMNLPYTMSPQMCAAAARMIMPKILYPYHYGETDPQELVKLLEGSGIEVRVRNLR